MAEARATVEFENDNVDSEEKEVKTDINPQEITDNPEKYARQVATEKAINMVRWRVLLCPAIM